MRSQRRPGCSDYEAFATLGDAHPLAANNARESNGRERRFDSLWAELCEGTPPWDRSAAERREKKRGQLSVVSLMQIRQAVTFLWCHLDIIASSFRVQCIHVIIPPVNHRRLNRSNDVKDTCLYKDHHFQASPCWNTERRHL